MTGRYDLFTLFAILLTFQLVIPPVISTFLIGVFGTTLRTGNPFFQRVIMDVSPLIAALVLVLTALFTVSFYAFWLLFYKRFIRYGSSTGYRYRQRVTLTGCVLVTLLGLFISWRMLGVAGGVSAIGYANIIQIRGLDYEGLGSHNIQFLFQFVQAFVLIAPVAIVYAVCSRRKVLSTIFAATAVIFCLLSASRRSYIIMGFVFFGVMTLYKNKIYWRHILLGIAILWPILVFGKPLLWWLSTGLPLGEAFAEVQQHAGGGMWSKVAEAMLDLGRSTTESWATLMYLHLPPRLGFDAILSIVRHLLFSQTLGLDIQWPERIVRISTSAFVGPHAADEPPGLIGQAWLDFRVFGPIVWGAIMAAQIAIIQYIYNRCEKGPAVIAVYVGVLYVAALFINTGSLDFTFSNDWILYVVLTVIICRTYRHKWRNQCSG